MRRRRLWRAAAVAAALFPFIAAAAESKPVDPKTGLVVDKGFDIVSAWCTSCHSARLITQSGKTRAQWLESIRWMQETQGLWDLGDKEDEILDYLARNYGVPERAGPPGVIPLPPR